MIKGYKTFIAVGVGIVFAFFLIIGVDLMEGRHWIDPDTHQKLDGVLFGIVFLALAFLRSALTELMTAINKNTEITKQVHREVEEIKRK